MATEHATVRLGFDRASFQRGLVQARSGFMAFKGALGALGVGFGLGALTAHLGRVRAFAESLQDTAQGLGVTTKFLQEFQGVAFRSGSSADGATKALEKLNMNVEKIRSGTGPAADAMRAMGVSAFKAGGQVKNTEELIYDIADAFKRNNDQAQKAAYANALFSESGVKMINTLSRGSEGIKDLGEKVRKLTDDDIANIDKFTVALKNLSNEAMVAGGKVVSASAPVAEGIVGWWKRTQDEIADLMVPSLIGDRLNKVQVKALGKQYDDAQSVSSAAVAGGTPAPYSSGPLLANMYPKLDAMRKAGMSRGAIAGLMSVQRLAEDKAIRYANTQSHQQALLNKGTAFDAMSLQGRNLAPSTASQMPEKNAFHLMGDHLRALREAAEGSGIKVIPHTGN